jgi:hypothetical protein
MAMTTETIRMSDLLGVHGIDIVVFVLRDLEVVVLFVIFVVLGWFLGGGLRKVDLLTTGTATGRDDV